jgi:orotate phosphoribosyltransferase-like protein
MTKTQAEFFKRRRKAYFKMKGLKYTDIAEELKLSDRTVSTIINLFPAKKSLRVQKYISQRLKVQYEKLWGSDPHHNSQILPEKKRVVND